MIYQPIEPVLTFQQNASDTARVKSSTTRERHLLSKIQLEYLLSRGSKLNYINSTLLIKVGMVNFEFN